jgi:putative acetyltransferase
MPQITPIEQSQAVQTRHMIYAVANDLFHDAPSLDEAIAYYNQEWPLLDLDDIQGNYIDQKGIFLVWVDGDRIIGSGAFKKLEEKVCEIKRIWLLPEYQGKGFGYRMMMELLSIARARGYEKARLETSPAYQPRAYALYCRLGFYDIPRYGDEEDDIGMELIL